GGFSASSEARHGEGPISASDIGFLSCLDEAWAGHHGGLDYLAQVMSCAECVRDEGSQVSQTTTTRALGPKGVSVLSEDLRLACMRISRRIRFESTDEDLAPHHFSVLARLEDGARTPRRLADIEKVSAPSMTRTVGSLVDAG